MSPNEPGNRTSPHRRTSWDSWRRGCTPASACRPAGAAGRPRRFYHHYRCQTTRSRRSPSRWRRRSAPTSAERRCRTTQWCGVAKRHCSRVANPWRDIEGEQLRPHRPLGEASSSRFWLVLTTTSKTRTHRGKTLTRKCVNESFSFLKRKEIVLASFLNRNFLIHSDEVIDVKCFDRQETEDDDDGDVNGNDDDGGKTDSRSESFWKKAKKTFRCKTETKVVSRNESCFCVLFYSCC